MEKKTFNLWLLQYLYKSKECYNGTVHLGRTLYVLKLQVFIMYTLCRFAALNHTCLLSSISWHDSFMQYMVFVHDTIHSKWFSYMISFTVYGFHERILSLTTPQEKKSTGWDVMIVVTIPLALFDLLYNCSSCTVMALCEGTLSCWKKSLLSCCPYNCAKIVSLSMLRYKSCVTVVYKKNRFKSPLYEKPAQTVITSWFNCPIITWRFSLE